MSHGVYAKT